MERRTTSPYPRLDRPVLAIVGLLLVASAVLFTMSDRAHDWRYYQYEFRRLVAEKLGQEKARTVPSGLQQIWVPALGHADRCTTCHQATAWKGFETAEEPYRTHPVEPLNRPVERFPELAGTLRLRSARHLPVHRLDLQCAPGRG